MAEPTKETLRRKIALLEPYHPPDASLLTTYRLALEALERRGQTCETCKHWTKPLSLLWPHRHLKSDGFGRCNYADSWSDNRLIKVSGKCNGDCQSYADDELLTRAEFGCNAWSLRDSPEGAEK